MEHRDESQPADGARLRRTRSVCPQCLRPLEAALVARGGGVSLEKTCPAHGHFSVPVWHGKVDMALWRRGAAPLAPEEGLSCPADCGICPEHRSGTCCALLEVTRRCDLNCRFCFARGGESQEEPPLAALMADVRGIMDAGDRPLLQLSGGEPTLRDDLPALVAWAKACGAPYVQLNTNGLRLARDEAYVRDLAGAGLSFVFLQFDGTNDAVYETLRGAPLLAKKTRAVELCGKYRLGVTLVPTVVRGVNDDQLGDIVRFAAAHTPVVRGVHFQPVSYFGRFPDPPADRYTLDELIAGLRAQAGLSADCLVPSHCDHPMCGLHGSFIVQPDRSLLPLSSFAAQEVGKTTAAQNRAYVAKHWLRAAEAESACCCGSDEPENPCCCGSDEVENPCCCGSDEPEGAQAAPEARAIDMDTFLRTARARSLTLSAMAFMDAENFDVERLRHCSLHVWRDGRLKPFCAAYLTPTISDEKT
jgi:uncharacterized radical SAM superfamily Fe-S cluster-containing enzyme